MKDDNLIDKDDVVTLDINGDEYIKLPNERVIIKHSPEISLSTAKNYIIVSIVVFILLNRVSVFLRFDILNYLFNLIGSFVSILINVYVIKRCRHFIGTSILLSVMFSAVFLGYIYLFITYFLH